MQRITSQIVILAITALFCVLGITGEVEALSGFEPGICGTGEYREVVFLGGTPVVFKGTLKETIKTRQELVQTSLNYRLEEPGGGKLSRSVKLSARVEKRGNQEVYVTNLDSYSETVDIGGQRFKTRKDGVFLNSTQVIDHQPIIDFVTRNWYLKKVFEVGKKEGTITVEMSGKADGYSNAWGSGETGIVQLSFNGEQKIAGSSSVNNWQGSARMVTNDTMSRSLRYVATAPELISFAGGFVDEKKAEQMLNIDYDMPTPNTSGILDNDGRNRNKLSMALSFPTEQKRLFVREFKDVRGHWACREIESLCGLGAFDMEGDYFVPGLPARRAEFVKALVVVGGFEPESTGKGATLRSRRTKIPAEEPAFFDIDTSHPYFEYLQFAGKKGLVQGTGGLFRPNDNLTRAEAVTILVRAMGLENLAPTPDYSTGFYDDRQIPLWARDAVYVAQSYGLLQGDLLGGMKVFRPQDVVTRAEAAAWLDELRDYLNRDFRQEYRDRVYRFAT